MSVSLNQLKRDNTELRGKFKEIRKKCKELRNDNDMLKDQLKREKKTLLDEVDALKTKLQQVIKCANYDQAKLREQLATANERLRVAP